MADVKWIKVTTDVFDDEKILLIESLPEADSIIVIWFKLLCLAGKQNNSGVFVMSNGIPYTDSMLATIFRRKETTVQLALQTFEKFGMIEVIDDAITIPNWGKHQNFDKIEKNNEYMKEYMREYRAKQKALSCKPNSKVNSKVNVSGLDKSREEEIRIDKSREENINYQQIADMYNEICISLPRVKSLSDARKKSIKARLRKYSLEDIQQAFVNAEESDFLKGDNPRNWTADFDWIMKDANIAKVLDGNYKNRGGNPQNQQSSVNNYIDMWRNA
jgi:predicted phage replisome organizer